MFLFLNLTSIYTGFPTETQCLIYKGLFQKNILKVQQEKTLNTKIVQYLHSLKKNYQNKECAEGVKKGAFSHYSG